MESHEDARAAIGANPRRYEVLKREGQADAPRTLPPPSERGLALDEGAVLCVISNCPQVNNPCDGFNPMPIRVLIWHDKT
jgi:uncharacterized protein YcgI (DUF1989 family)